MYKSEINYNDIKDKLKFKGNSKVEYPIPALKSEIEELKAVATAIKTKYVFPGKGNNKSSEIPSWMKTPPKNVKFYKESNGKTYHWCKCHGENAPR